MAERLPKQRSDSQSSAHNRNGDETPSGTLRDKVQQALLAIIDDPEASAAAKASACRTLLDFFASDKGRDDKRAAEMSIAELDEELARLSSK